VSSNASVKPNSGADNDIDDDLTDRHRDVSERQAERDERLGGCLSRSRVISVNLSETWLFTLAECS